MKVRDIMSTDVITVQEKTDIHSLARLLTEQRISGCPVTDDRGELVGVVSLYDLATHQGNVGDSSQYWHTGPHLPKGYSVKDVNPSDVRVEQIMTPACYSVEQDEEVTRVLDFFLKGEIHRVLVTENGKLVGIVTGTDLIRLLETYLTSKVV